MAALVGGDGAGGLLGVDVVGREPTSGTTKARKAPAGTAVVVQRDGQNVKVEARLVEVKPGEESNVFHAQTAVTAARVTDATTVTEAAMSPQSGSVWRRRSRAWRRQPPSWYQAAMPDRRKPWPWRVGWSVASPRRA